MTNDERDRRAATEALGAPSAQPIEASAPADLRCVRCNAPAPNAVCGRKTSCPACGFPYPLGDCSDLAEN